MYIYIYIYIRIYILFIYVLNILKHKIFSAFWSHEMSKIIERQPWKSGSRSPLLEMVSKVKRSKVHTSSSFTRESTIFKMVPCGYFRKKKKTGSIELLSMEEIRLIS